jgi:CheY-like chemotaxis protein
MDAGVALAEKGSGQEELTTRKAKILVMDDEEMIREFATEVLHNMGYEAVIASNGAKAIELYRSAMESGHPFDVAILDLTIPDGMGGKEAVQKLLDIDPEIKAIVSSGFPEDSVVTDFQRYGFRGAIEKPYDFEELRDLLSKLMSE